MVSLGVWGGATIIVGEWAVLTASLIWVLSSAVKELLKSCREGVPWVPVRDEDAMMVTSGDGDVSETREGQCAGGDSSKVPG